MIKIWECDSFSVYSDGEKFIAQLQAGIEGESYLSVGYSSPNGALTTIYSRWTPYCTDVELQKAYEENYRVPYNILEILVGYLQNYYLTRMKFLDFDLMLPELYKLAQEANWLYNRFLCSESEWDVLRELYGK